MASWLAEVLAPAATQKMLGMKKKIRLDEVRKDEIGNAWEKCWKRNVRSK